jgi:hypothetical protein
MLSRNTPALPPPAVSLSAKVSGEPVPMNEPVNVCQLDREAHVVNSAHHRVEGLADFTRRAISDQVKTVVAAAGGRGAVRGVRDDIDIVCRHGPAEAGGDGVVRAGAARPDVVVGRGSGERLVLEPAVGEQVGRRRRRRRDGDRAERDDQECGFHFPKALSAFRCDLDS